VTRSIDTDATAAALDERLTALNAELSQTRELAVAAQVKAATGGPGVQEEADRLDGEVQRLERSIAATRDALAAVGEAGEAIADEIEQARAKQHRKKVAAIVRKCRGLAEAEDAALDSVIAARKALREGLGELWEAADGPARSGELSELPTIINNLPLIAVERLAHGNVMASRSSLLDRSAPAPSVADHLDRVLDLIAPGPGRPKNLGSEGTAA
jgi:hypothetical protein